MEQAGQPLNEPINPDGEYRIYVSNKGEEPEAKDIRGTQLHLILGMVRNVYPRDTIYIREVHEAVVRVVWPEEAIGNDFHFTS